MFLDAGYWLAASCCTAAVALTATDAAQTLEKILLELLLLLLLQLTLQERLPARKHHAITLPSEPTRNQLQSAAPVPSKQVHNEVLAGGCETAKHHGPEGRNDLQETCCPGA